VRRCGDAARRAPHREESLIATPARYARLTVSMRRVHRALARLVFSTVLTTWLATVVPVVCEHGLTSPYVHARFGHGAIHVLLPPSQAAVPVASPAEDALRRDTHASSAHPSQAHPSQAHPSQAHPSQAHPSQAQTSQKDDQAPAPVPALATQQAGERSAPPAHVHPAALSAMVSSQPPLSGPFTLLSAGLFVPARPLPAAQVLERSPLSFRLPPGRLPDPPPERPPAM
jgi:hypothetical protein